MHDLIYSHLHRLFAYTSKEIEGAIVKPNKSGNICGEVV